METIYQSLNRIWLRCKAGKSAALAFEADGTEYIRNFRPKERLILLGGGQMRVLVEESFIHHTVIRSGRMKGRWKYVESIFKNTASPGS